MYVCKTNFKCLTSKRNQTQVIFKAGEEYTGPDAAQFLADGFIEEVKTAKAEAKETAPKAAPATLAKPKKTAPKASVAQAG